MAQPYDHTLEPVHGGQAGPLVKHRPIEANSLSKAYAGRVGYLDNNGNVVVGAPPAKTEMPVYILRGIESPSVYDGLGTQSTPAAWVPGGATRAILLVATGGFEVQTTEYDTNGTYNVNTYLTVDANGFVTPANLANLYAVGSPWIVGVCSVHENAQNIDDPWANATSPIGKNANRKTVLTYWTYFLPGK
ncbi:MAG: hypothetical protein KatS3mg087_0123 [Patescibacteria group bacterium]|nr:MAG: hypothetical protein KatS3mg087_0123 [Patescibacteria group bacterium]